MKTILFIIILAVFSISSFSQSPSPCENALMQDYQNQMRNAALIYETDIQKCDEFDPFSGIGILKQALETLTAKNKAEMIEEFGDLSLTVMEKLINEQDCRLAADSKYGALLDQATNSFFNNIKICN